MGRVRVHRKVSDSDKQEGQGVLEYLGEEFKYIGRHRDGTLFAYKDGLTNWFSLNCRFDVDFPMVKWEGNEEIWSIEDLKKLEVVDSYEQRNAFQSETYSCNFR